MNPSHPNLNLAKELGLEPDTECNINTAEGRKVWAEIEDELGME